MSGTSKAFKWISVTEALAITDEIGHSVTRPTMITWIKDKERYPNLGKKVGGRWRVDRNALMFYLHEGSD